MNNYEQLVEFIINDETDKARELFHNIVVEKSRDIYESLMDETEQEIGGNEVEDLAKDVELDEQGLAEEEEFDSEESEMDFDQDGELDAHEEEHVSDDDRISDLETALDELKAEFDTLMAGEEEEPEHAEMFGHDEAGEEEGDEELEDEMDDTMVREYVEKVASPTNTATKSKSPVAGKNDMGGSAKNIAQGGEETGAAAEKAQAIKSGNINVPGGKAGDAFTTKETAK